VDGKRLNKWETNRKLSIGNDPIDAEISPTGFEGTAGLGLPSIKNNNDKRVI
jgi:hypothetical protein